MESIRNSHSNAPSATTPTPPIPPHSHQHPILGGAPIPSTPHMSFNVHSRTAANVPQGHAGAAAATGGVVTSVSSTGPFPDVVPTHKLTFDVSLSCLFTAIKLFPVIDLLRDFFTCHA